MYFEKSVIYRGRLESYIRATRRANLYRKFDRIYFQVSARVVSVTKCHVSRFPKILDGDGVSKKNRKLNYPTYSYGILAFLGWYCNELFIILIYSR